MKRYDKLVRDRIPEIIGANGKRSAVRTLTDAEYMQRLDQKLVEELTEYQESGDLDELADLVELVQTITAHRGMSWDAFEAMRAHKREERGGFGARLLLEMVFTSEDDRT